MYSTIYPCFEVKDIIFKVQKCTLDSTTPATQNCTVKHSLLSQNKIHENNMTQTQSAIISDITLDANNKTQS